VPEATRTISAPHASAVSSSGYRTELASYDDWGAASFETTAWSAPESYTGHPQDPTQGLVHRHARSYDTATGTWTSPDTWRGLLSAPKSLARYQYAWDNPTTYLDPDGHRCAARMGINDGLLVVTLALIDIGRISRRVGSDIRPA